MSNIVYQMIGTVDDLDDDDDRLLRILSELATRDLYGRRKIEVREKKKTSAADIIHGIFFSISECINLSMIEKLDGLPVI